MAMGEDWRGNRKSQRNGGAFFAAHEALLEICFGGTYRLHLQSRRINARKDVRRFLLAPDISSTLKMEVTRISETSDHNKATR
jgi:hypothetical protein